MRLKQTSKLSQWPILVGFLLIGLLVFQTEGYGMGELDRKLSGKDYYEKVEQAKPIIKQRTDQILTQLDYDPTKLAAVVVPKGEGGDEAWMVKYWYTSPKDYVETVRRGDIEVYLNNQGKVRRVMKYEQGQEQLLYGKDERIAKGMTQDEVRAHLGEPDRKGLPQREIRDLADETWTYKASPTGRTMTIEVDFKDGKVFSYSSFGK